MFNLIDIIKHNRNTFYDYSTNEKLSVRNSYIVKFFLSFIISLVFAAPSEMFINAVLAIHAILLGFSFNVIFYILGNDKLSASKTEASIEKGLRANKINRLSDEIFFNVSYFNIVALSVIVAALCFFLFNSPIRDVFPDIKKYQIVYLYIIWLKNIVIWAYALLFYFLIVESLFSFGRSIGRLSYYFQKRIELKN